MVIAVARSKNTVPIRLTEERWLHIVSSHREIDPLDFSSIMDAVENPDVILKGDRGELLALRKYGKKVWFVVAYKEVSATDGFVLTTYITTNVRWLLKREVIWNKEIKKE